MRTLKEEEDPLGGGVILSLSLHKSVVFVSLDSSGNHIRMLRLGISKNTF